MSGFDVKRIDEINPSWWSAIAGAAAAGAILFPEHRIVAGALAGAAMLALAIYKLPCCAGCGDAKTGCGGAKPSPASVPDPAAPTPTPQLTHPTALLAQAGRMK